VKSGVNPTGGAHFVFYRAPQYNYASELYVWHLTFGRGERNSGCSKSNTNGHMSNNQRQVYQGSLPRTTSDLSPSKSGQPRPAITEDTLKSVEVQIERKAFVFALKENPRGRFLRITEDVGGRRDTIIVPSTGLGEFQKLIAEMVKASESIPEKSA
jgi:hypothetical protein